MCLFTIGGRNIDIQDLSIGIFFFLIFVCGPVALSIDIKQSDALRVSTYATQTVEITRANATGETIAHVVETSAARADIIVILDSDPTRVGPLEALSLSYRTETSRRRGVRGREDSTAIVAGRHTDLVKGSVVTLRCGEGVNKAICLVIAAATPTPTP